MRSPDRPENDGRWTVVPIASRLSRLMTVCLIALVLIGAWVALVAWRERRLNDAVRALPPDVQEATFRRTYEELATTCRSEPALVAHCTDEAQLILRFPQCAADCQELARRYIPLGKK